MSRLVIDSCDEMLASPFLREVELTYFHGFFPLEIALEDSTAHTKCGYFVGHISPHEQCRAAKFEVTPLPYDRQRCSYPHQISESGLGHQNGPRKI